MGKKPKPVSSGKDQDISQNHWLEFQFLVIDSRTVHVRPVQWLTDTGELEAMLGIHNLLYLGHCSLTIGITCHRGIHASCSFSTTDDEIILQEDGGHVSWQKGLSSIKPVQLLSRRCSILYITLKVSECTPKLCQQRQMNNRVRKFFGWLRGV